MKITNARAILSRWRLFFLAAVLVVAGGVKAIGLRNNQGYAPTQPIAFSHKLHAGDLGMDCLYCHSNAEKSAHATVPSVDACMGCHSVVRTDRPEIQKLTEYYASGKSIPWVRVHRLPDVVAFSHKAHVAAGVACQQCHGPVETMDILAQNANLSMGWCLSCHRNDEYLKTPERQFALREKVAEGFGDPKAAAEFESLKKSLPFWNAEDLERLTAPELGKPGADAAREKLVQGALGYNSLARQAGTGAVDHVSAFQNASINCNICHQ